MPSLDAPGPKYYEVTPTEYRVVPTWKIGTGLRPPLAIPVVGPGPGENTGRVWKERTVPKIRAR